MPRLISALALLALATAGCATAPPTSTTIGEVRDAPEAFKNDLVEVHGRVINYREPQGDLARTWNFSVEDRDGQVINVFTDRRSPDDIAQADRLVARAVDEGGLVFVAGYVRVGKFKNTSGPVRLDLRQVAYDEEVVKLGLRSQYDPYDSRFSFGIGYGHHHGFYDSYYYHRFPH